MGAINSGRKLYGEGRTPRRGTACAHGGTKAPRRPSSIAGRWFWCVVVLVAFLVGPWHAPRAETVKLSYAEPAADYVGFFIAVEKGFYAKEGIDVELVRAGGGIATPALISGDIQFSTSASSAISAILRGARLKVISVTEDRPDYQLWASGPSIQTFDDLRGKQVGVITRGDTGEIALRYALMTRRLPPDFIAFTPLGPGPARLATLASKTLPATLLYWLETSAISGDRKFDHAHLLTDLRREVRMVFNGLATSDKLIANQPGLVRRFVHATLEGIAYAKAHRDQAVDILARYEKSSIDAAGAEYDHIVPAIVSDGIVPQDLQARELRLRAEMLGIAKDGNLPPSKVFDFTFVRSASSQPLGQVRNPSASTEEK